MKKEAFQIHGIDMKKLRKLIAHFFILNCIYTGLYSALVTPQKSCADLTPLDRYMIESVAYNCLSDGEKTKRANAYSFASFNQLSQLKHSLFFYYETNLVVAATSGPYQNPPMCIKDRVVQTPLMGQGITYRDLPKEKNEATVSLLAHKDGTYIFSCELTLPILTFFTYLAELKPFSKLHEGEEIVWIDCFNYRYYVQEDEKGLLLKKKLSTK